MTPTRPRLVAPPHASLPPGAWRSLVAIRFGHCDPAGIVFTPRWFDILNGVLEDWFTERLGLPYAELIGPRRIGLGYAGLAADFAQPGKMGDVVEVAVLVAKLGGSSIAVELPAYRAGEPLFMATKTIVTTSLVAHRAIPVPDDVRAAVEAYAEGCR